jgi:hypothetical protein
LFQISFSLKFITIFNFEGIDTSAYALVFHINFPNNVYATMLFFLCEGKYYLNWY